jgi:hypothetical protein
VGGDRAFAGRDQLTGVVSATFGRGRRLVSAARMRGGSRKGVYRLTVDNGRTAILYIWNAAENYWPGAHQQAGLHHADPFADATGLDLFQASQARLEALGVRTPRVLLLDPSREHYPADLAVVEDVPGPTLETLLRRDAPGARPALDTLAAALQAMHHHQGRRLGKLAYVDDTRSRSGPPSRSCSTARSATSPRRPPASRASRMSTTN